MYRGYVQSGVRWNVRLIIALPPNEKSECRDLVSEISLNNDENWIIENMSMVKDCAVFGVVFLQCDQSGRDLKVLRPMNQQRGERNIYPYKKRGC